MKYFSPQATEQTPKCEKFSDSDMVANMMRAMPESWQNDLLKSAKGNMPETTRKPETHVTKKCRKWNADGTPKNKESSHKDKKAHKAFAQLKSKTEYNKKLLKKLLKKTSPARRVRSVTLMTLPIQTVILLEGVGPVAQRNYM
jgi:hypothetical protein